jgi:hypothetical protein
MDSSAQLPPVAKQVNKHRAVRLYLNDENDGTLRKLADEMGPELEESKLASVLLAAALRAVKVNGYKIPLPLRFSIEEETFNPRILKDAPTKK